MAYSERSLFDITLHRFLFKEVIISMAIHGIFHGTVAILCMAHVWQRVQYLYIDFLGSSVYNSPSMCARLGSM